MLFEIWMMITNFTIMLAATGSFLKSFQSTSPTRPVLRRAETFATAVESN